MIRDDEDCGRCGVAAVRRTCDECGVSAMITDCGCQIQPRPIAADGRRTYCDDCYEDRAAKGEA